MGISGLLPFLKSIQVERHLSELSGQTLAIDAYGWLHRGVYGCATEIATGIQTTKYVEFTMQRVRLLRHNHIEPYLVFDGGPLLAKKGTDDGREQRRAENLSRGKAFAAQGRHNQAREHYVKAIDVTPQMAYQLIKALKASSVPYVVAPYEADAQMAYLEKIGLVDGIITEDSDLLVFGCKKVFYKLDAASSTLISISRDDFGSVDSTWMSLNGFTDSKFRAMAILSGCDYLPSIPGIGLKTAYALLKKCGSVEKVVRSLSFEGKKRVPKDYLEKFRMAEMCFLHQRVYDPASEQLVHLTDITEGLNDEVDAYIGKHLNSEIAKKVAVGDVDPITLCLLVDAQPTYTPKAKVQPLNETDMNRKGKQKKKRDGNHTQPPTDGGILRFFGPKATPGSVTHKLHTLRQGPAAGRNSGKRTLADTMDHDIAARKKRKSEEGSTPLRLSRFFCDDSRVDGPHDEEYAYPERREKENQRPSDGQVEDISSNLSQEASINSDSEHDFGDLEPENVPQEDGYLSPTSCSDLRWQTPELSSPPRRSPVKRGCSRSAFDVEVIQSPSTHRQPLGCSPSHDCIHTPDIVSPPSGNPDDISPFHASPYVNTFNVLEDDIDEMDAPENGQDCQAAEPPPDTGLSLSSASADIVHASRAEEKTMSIGEKTLIVATGWRERWGFKPEDLRQRPTLPFRRHETTIAPLGKQKHTVAAITRSDSRLSMRTGSGGVHDHISATRPKCSDDDVVVLGS